MLQELKEVNTLSSPYCLSAEEADAKMKLYLQSFNEIREGVQLFWKGPPAFLKGPPTFLNRTLASSDLSGLASTAT